MWPLSGNLQVNEGQMLSMVQRWSTHQVAGSLPHPTFDYVQKILQNRRIGEGLGSGHPSDHDQQPLSRRYKTKLTMCIQIMSISFMPSCRVLCGTGKLTVPWKYCKPLDYNRNTSLVLNNEGREFQNVLLSISKWNSKNEIWQDKCELELTSSHHTEKENNLIR